MFGCIINYIADVAASADVGASAYVAASVANVAAPATNEITGIFSVF